MSSNILTNLIKKLNGVLASKQCMIGKNSVLYPESEIINIKKEKDRIKIGNNTHIRGQLLVFGHGGKINVGDFCYVGKNTCVWSAKEVRIGNRVLISHNCNIFDSDTHPLDAQGRHEQFKHIITTGHPREIDLKEENVYIKDDVLIGTGVIVLKGVTIGEGAVVGAGSVVTKNVEPFTIVAGNPAKLIRKLI